MCARKSDEKEPLELEIKTKIFLSILAVEGRLKRVARSGEEKSWTISGKLNGFKIRKKIANVS